MKYKILTPDENGNFVFTKDELEKLLEEVYNEGVEEGKKYTITTPGTWKEPWKIEPTWWRDGVTTAEPKPMPNYYTWCCTGKGKDVLLNT